jgi:antitoxin PrlF
MLAVVTSKGQLTLPKGIREHLGLSAGSRLDFQVDERGWLMARPVTNTALGLAGLLKRPGQKAMSVEAMADAVERSAVELNAPGLVAHSKAKSARTQRKA